MAQRRRAVWGTASVILAMGGTQWVRVNAPILDLSGCHHFPGAAHDSPGHGGDRRSTGALPIRYACTYWVPRFQSGVAESPADWPAIDIAPIVLRLIVALRGRSAPSPQGHDRRDAAGYPLGAAISIAGRRKIRHTHFNRWRKTCLRPCYTVAKSS